MKYNWKWAYGEKQEQFDKKETKSNKSGEVSVTQRKL